jgi:hypothetical protein
VLKTFAGKDAGDDGAQLFLVGRAVLPMSELGIGDEIRPFEHLRYQPAV